MKFRWRGMLLLLGITLALLPGRIAMAAPGDVIFSDDFESYLLTTHPAPWGEILGRADDVVTDEWSAGGIQSFVTVSDDGLLPKRPIVDLDAAGLLPLPRQFCYEATVHVDGDPESSVAVGFWFIDPRFPGRATVSNAVAFKLDGKVMWYGRISKQLGVWTPGTEQTFTVKVQIDFPHKMASVTINGRNAGDGLAAWPRTIPARSIYGEEIPLDKFGFGPAHNFRGDGTARVFIDDVSLCEANLVLCEEGAVKIRPRTINLKSRGRFITVFIELPRPLDARNIDISTLRMGVPGKPRVAALLRPTSLRDRDRDGLFELMVKFPRQEVQAILEVGRRVEIFVTGEVADGTRFRGSDFVRVIKPGRKKNNGHPAPPPPPLPEPPHFGD